MKRLSVVVRAFGCGCALLSGLVLVWGCGIDNPYKEREKKCKVNCTKNSPAVPDKVSLSRTDPREARPEIESTYLSLTWWLQELSSAQALPKTTAAKNPDRVGDIISVNPFLGGAKLAKSSDGAQLPSVVDYLQNVVAMVKQASGIASSGKALSKNGQCLVDAFQGNFRSWGEGAQGTVNYGRCIALDNATQSAKTGEFLTEYEAGFKVAEDPVAAGAHLFADLLSLPPFVRGADGSSLVNRNLHQLQVVVESGVATEDGKTVSEYFRRWDMFALGESEATPFRIDRTDGGSGITMNGRAVFFSGAMSNPQSPPSFSDESSKIVADLIQFDFRNFGFVGEQLEVDDQFGFKTEVALSGSYMIGINNLRFRATAVPALAGAACRATVQLAWVKDDAGNSIDKDLGTIDLCGVLQ